MATFDISPLDRHDDEALSGLLRRAALPEPTEHEIARLRRNLRERIERDALRSPAHSLTRMLALACSVTVGVAALWMMSSDAFAPDRVAAEQAGLLPAPRIARLEDGSVEISFETTRNVRVTRSSDPAAKTDVVVSVAKNGQFVDESTKQEPGTVVFYRFD